MASIETSGGRVVSGIVVDDRLVPIADLAATGVGFVEALLGAEAATRSALQEAAAAMTGIALDGTRLLPPLPHPPRNLFCIGTNYKAHFDEGTRPDDTRLPTEPVVFTKPFTTQVGATDAIRIPPAAQRVDWEAEVAVVIGRGGRDIAVEDAHDHVFGYTLANDVSARDLQLREGNLNQWFMGKSPDTFCPIGPWVTTGDELGGDPITFELTVNGVPKQKGTTALLIFDVPTLVHLLSRTMTLLPGDIILTGTPAGVGQWRTPKEFLSPGDVVRIESPQLGVLENPVTTTDEPR
jgi:2-keto-4-pentenoate hydratase/2-oxohepta-3-ene-1,7-dioic acid hydratase in catechol pathway